VQLNYAEWIHLDAEDLAEAGICKAYDALLPTLRHYVAQPETITETDDANIPRYSVRGGEKEFLIYDPDIPEGDSWGRATFAFFSIVNQQLAKSEFRFYAINGGNDLGGMFLKPREAHAAREALPNKHDWPYLPTDEPPFYGMYH
jgi:hypothetical protein